MLNAQGFRQDLTLKFSFLICVQAMVVISSCFKRLSKASSDHFYCFKVSLLRPCFRRYYSFGQIFCFYYSRYDQSFQFESVAFFIAQVFSFDL